MKLNEMLGRHFIGKPNGCVSVPYADITGVCPPDTVRGALYGQKWSSHILNGGITMKKKNACFNISDPGRPADGIDGSSSFSIISVW